MKRKTLALLGVLTILFVASAGVHAEEVEVGVTGNVTFREDAKALREQIQAERKALMEKNKQTRQEASEKNKAARKALMEENKEEREKFREDTKNSLEGKTPEERAALMVTIKADRKALFDQNQTQKQEQRKSQWDSKKSVTENIRLNVDTFQATVRSRWLALWASFEKK